MEKYGNITKNTPDHEVCGCKGSCQGKSAADNTKEVILQLDNDLTAKLANAAKAATDSPKK